MSAPTTAANHVPKEWADRCQGEFDDGWDVQRERTGVLENTGIIRSGASCEATA